MPAATESSISRDNITKLGIIAGGGSLPERLLHACDRRGIEVFIVGFEGQTDRTLMRGRVHMITRLGAAGRIIETLKAHGVQDLVMIGSIRRPGLAELRPDLRTIQFFAKRGFRALGDDGLLTALRQELEEEGFRIHGVQRFVDDLVARAGIMGTVKPKKSDMADIRRGFEVLKITGAADVGQSVIVHEGIVLGLEAAEGTDELIRRCAHYRSGPRGGILVKAAKPGQDRDLDLPAIGPGTVHTCMEAGVTGIAFQADNCLVIKPQQVADLADHHKIFIGGFDPEKLASHE